MVHPVSSTSVRVSWLPPPEEDQNGVIIGYQLQLNSTSDPRFHLTQSLIQNLTQLISGKSGVKYSGMGIRGNMIMVPTKQQI